jgi:ATP-dependent Lon protease
LSYVRSRADSLNIPSEFFEKHDLHMHIPAGSQPKDGPSAGVAMATSLVSLISGRKVKPQTGMTGEISLRGQVLPIGGVKEKVLAAHRNGLTTVILPKRNEQDIDDVPEEVRQSMKFIFAESVEDVLNSALEAAKPAKIHPKKTAGKKSDMKKVKKNDKAKSPARRR